MRHVVVVGASIGGVRTVSELRAAGFDGRITLVAPDAGAPYDRPPLSKQILTGDWPPERASLGDPAGQWSAHLIGKRAVSLDVDAHEIRLAGGDRLRYDTLVLATGATATRLSGAAYPGVHALRTMDDCLALRRSLHRGGPLVVVGGGFIGAEVASSARSLGIPATIVEALDTPMSRVLGDEVGGLLTGLHERNGVEVRCATSVSTLEGSDRVEKVVLADGTRLPADTVLVGIGVRPSTGWLEGSGLRLDDGVLCDEYCAAVGVPDVYALGDVARWFDRHAGAHVRVEHWTTAAQQANVVAHNIVHPDQLQVHRAHPYFWSDQHGVKIQLVGHTAPDSDEVTIIRSGDGKERVAALYHDAGTLRAGFTINWPRALAAARSALENDLPATETVARLEALSG